MIGGFVFLLGCQGILSGVPSLREALMIAGVALPVWI